MTAHLLDAAIAGEGLPALLDCLCRDLEAACVPVYRAAVGSLLVHPLLDATLVVWRRGEGSSVVDTPRPQERGREPWRHSPYHQLLVSDRQLLRRRLDGSEALGDFTLLAELAREGATDYLALRTTMGRGAMLGEGRDLFSSWVTDRPGGFTEGELATLRALERQAVPLFAGALNRATAATLLATYLGQDAAGRVLGGAIERVRTERIEAVIWYSDLEGFTRLSDTLPGEAVLELLNLYAEVLVDAIERAGGEVLKFMGDGILAIFRASDPAAACEAALAAWGEAQALAETLSRERAAAVRPVTRPYLALHIGEVLYGNVGGRARLDFTVLGPAVNEASRIVALCRSLDQPAILSEAFAAGCPTPTADRLLRLGRFALRGVSRPQMLWALAPAGQALR